MNRESRHGVPSPGTALAANLVTGARLALGRRADAADLVATLGQALTALAIAAGACAMLERLEAGALAQFWIWGFIATAAQLQVWLAAGALLAWMTGRDGTFLVLTVALTYGLLPVWTVTTVAGHVPPALGFEPGDTARNLLLGATITWQFAVFWRVLGLLPRLGFAKLAGANAVFAAALAGVSAGLPDPSMFYVPSRGSGPRLDVESVYYRQQSLLDEQLGALEAQDPDAVDLYFVGVGAFAAEDVFMREIVQVRKLFASEFGTRRRSVALINNPATVGDTPLANRHNLERVLSHLGSTIDVEQDIVFLFLTSHGYEDASVAVDFVPLGLNDLSAREIRDAFDAAGIRWRVIVISACYSGSFIESLESPATVLMTASSHDRSSFGCSHESEWTYFGRAYFDQALRQTREFVSAFALAEVIVGERERREGKEASNPQIRAGRQIREHLTKWRAPPRPAASR